MLRLIEINKSLIVEETLAKGKEPSKQPPTERIDLVLLPIYNKVKIIIDIRLGVLLRFSDICTFNKKNMEQMKKNLMMSPDMMMLDGSQSGEDILMNSMSSSVSCEM